MSEKSKEITAIPEVIDSLDIKGALVSIDAIGCQKNIAGKITEKGGNYLLSLKGNQSTLQEAVEEVLRRTDTRAQARYEVSDFSEEKKKAHGREEQRSCRVVYRKKEKDGWGFVDPEDDCANLNTLIRVSSYRKDLQTGKEERKDRLYISSIKTKAEDTLRSVRNHWHVENKLHWVLDVQFGEDHSQKRDRAAAANVSTLRRAVINIFKQDKAFKKVAKSRIQAILNIEFIEKLIFGRALERLGPAWGEALDEIAEYGPSRLFGELGFEIGMEQKLFGKTAHLDSTSFSVEGEYPESLGEGVSAIRVTHGYSKDYRPDLKQVMMSRGAGSVVTSIDEDHSSVASIQGIDGSDAIRNLLNLMS